MRKKLGILVPFQGTKSRRRRLPHTGKRPDYFGISKDNPHDRIVGDAKYVKELTSENVRQVRSYKGYPFYANKGVIFVKKTTKVPDDVREEARDSDIKIIRKRARAET